MESPIKNKPEVLSLKLIKANGDIVRTFFNGTLQDAAKYYKVAADNMSDEDYETQRIVEIIVLNKKDEEVMA